VCARLRCKTVADSAQVRLAVVTIGESASAESYSEHVAVWKSSGRTTPLGDYEGFDCSCLGPFALVGRYLGYAVQSVSHEEPWASFYGVARLNVQTGRREEASVDFHGPSTNTRCVGQVSGSGSGVTAIVATAAGTVAWILEAGAGSGVLCEMPAGSNTPLVLAESTGLVPDSLAVAPGRLYWMEGAGARTTTIR
jgi:hypothetical protein